LAFWLSGALAACALIGSAAGTFMPHLFRDPDGTAGSARGTCVVTLFVAIPTLLIAMSLAARGSFRALLVWLGALAYLVYNAVIFAFAIAFNPLFLIYVATLSFGVWALVALLSSVEPSAIRARFDATTPRRMIATYLAIAALTFTVLWLMDIVPALVSGGTPASLAATRMLTNPIQVLDLAIGLPMTLVAAWLLWRRRAWGYTLAGLFAVYFAIESASIATDQYFGNLSDPSQPTTAVPIFMGVTVIALTMAVAYLLSLHRAPCKNPLSS
jgi:hypothetical protein